MMKMKWKIKNMSKKKWWRKKDEGKSDHEEKEKDRVKEKAYNKKDNKKDDREYEKEKTSHEFRPILQYR